MVWAAAAEDDPYDEDDGLEWVGRGKDDDVDGSDSSGR